MKIFTVYIDKNAENPKETATLVPESFSWAGMIFPINIFWAVSNRAWLFLGIVFLLEMGTYIAITWGWLLPPYSTFLRLPIIFALGLFANDFRRHSLESRGYTLETVVSGKDQVEAQLRFFENSANIHQ